MAILEPNEGAIPDLPKEVTQIILSLLPIKDGARASCLSKTWMNAWRKRSILHFDENVCYTNPRNSRREGFLNYGNRELQIFREGKIGMDYFKIKFTTPLESEWIQVALQNGIKKLELVGLCRSIVLPGIIFEAKSPLKLSVKGYGYSILELPRSMTISQNIKSLHLSSLYLCNSDLQRITLSCPKIEDLIIRDCFKTDSFKIANLCKLKHFEFISRSIVIGRTLEIEATNLEFLDCSGFNSFSVGASQNLKRLQLSKVGITDEFFVDFKYKFPHLEDLTIDFCPYLHRIRLSTASLRKMKLLTDRDDSLEELHVNAPNMTQFELGISENYSFKELKIDAPNMTLFKYTGALISKVSFTSSAYSCCSHICVTTVAASIDWTSYFVKFKEFLKNFSKSKIYLSFSQFQGDVGKLDLEGMDLQSFVAIQVLEVNLYALHGLENFLEGIFWICQPKTIRIVSQTRDEPCGNNITFPRKCSELAKFISKYLMVARDHNRDGSSSVKLGKRRVKQMTFQEHNAINFYKNALELEMES